MTVSPPPPLGDRRALPPVRWLSDLYCAGSREPAKPSRARGGGIARGRGGGSCVGFLTFGRERTRIFTSEVQLQFH